MTTEHRGFTWSHGSGTVSSLAGMLLRASFDVGGRNFSPFASAPWSPDLAIPGHLRELAAEFVCVPFGSGATRAGLPSEWRSIADESGEVKHGFGAEAEWTFLPAPAGGVRLAIDYPDNSPIARLERHIRGVDGRPELAFGLTVHARKRASTSLGLHPILRLPDAIGDLRIEAAFAEGFTPAAPVHETSTIAALQRFSTLAEVGMDLPVIGRPHEDIVQLAGVKGPIVANFASEAAAIAIDWDHDQLPSALIWVSDGTMSQGGGPEYFRGIGIEPVASAFDLQLAVSTGDNPIRSSGVATSIDLDPGFPLQIEYSIRAFATDEQIGLHINE